MFRRVLPIVLRVMLAGVAASWLNIQTTPFAVAATLTPKQVADFLADPAKVLQQNPNGGAELVSLVRDLLLADASTLNSIIALLASANPAQQSSIGAGLGQAAQALLRINPALSSQIQFALLNSNSQPAIASYSAVTGNVLIGSAGGGGGGGAGGGPTGSGPPQGGANSTDIITTTGGTPNTTSTFLTGGGVGVLTGSGVTTAINSVSP